MNYTTVCLFNLTPNYLALHNVQLYFNGQLKDGSKGATD